MKVKHTQNGNVKITLTLEEAARLNGALHYFGSCIHQGSDEVHEFASELEDALDATDEIGVIF